MQPLFTQQACVFAHYSQAYLVCNVLNIQNDVEVEWYHDIIFQATLPVDRHILYEFRVKWMNSKGRKILKNLRDSVMLWKMDSWNVKYVRRAEP